MPKFFKDSLILCLSISLLILRRLGEGSSVTSGDFTASIESLSEV